MPWKVAIQFLFVLAMLAPSIANGQDLDAAPDGADQSITTGEGVVDLEQRGDDTEIEARISGILAATDRYQRLEVQVVDGVVFITGVATSEATRTLASDLSRRVEGVAAVVNNLSVAEPPAWSLSPARVELIRLLRDAIRMLPLLGAGLIIFIAAWLLGRGVAHVAGRFFAGRTESELLQGVIRKAVFITIVLIGVYLALRVSGLTRAALTVVSGTGLIGLILGFAFRDIAENFLASLLLSIQRPFRLGDLIEVDGHLGIVRKVTSRGTLLIDFDGNHIQIANSTVYKNTIKNYTANPLVRINFMVGIGYDDTISHAQQIIRGVLDAHPSVLSDPEPLVLVEQAGASTINLRVYAWIDGARHSMLKMKSSLIRLVVNALADAGVSMPDEAREVIFPKGVPITQAEAPPPRPKREPDVAPSPARDGPVRDEAVAVEAEGDLTSEAPELERQANRARDPEKGANVLK